MSATKDPGSHGRKIPLSQAKKMIADYKAKAAPDHLRSLTISADHLRKIIDQPGCQHVRFYVGLKDPDAKAIGVDNAHSLIAVGVDAKNTNMIAGEDSEVYEEMTHCPPTCNDDGSFNSL